MAKKTTSLSEWLHLKRYQFELTFSLYMLTPWEKFVIYSILFLLLSLTVIAALLYLPHHISFIAGRAWYYFNGEHIDVAEAAREVVEKVSAGVLTGQGVGRKVETVVREL